VIVQHPKPLGGLGVLDLTKFNRALRLRWHWQKWNKPDKPSSCTPLLHANATEIALFNACTTITLGNGRKIKFWTDPWLQGSSPKEIAPKIHLLAYHKNYTVAQALDGGKWMRGLQRISAPEQLTEFVKLWALVAQVRCTGQSNRVPWRFTKNGVYSSLSANHTQFLGAFADHDWRRIWNSKVENKCKLFSWLLLQNRLWTADRLARHAGQTNTICQLCRT
jgi:hypothetical protein